MPMHARRRQLPRATALALLALLAAWATTGTASASAPQRRDASIAVVNGSEVDEATFRARWPFVVALVSSRARDQYDGQFCGGSLVDDQHVVTAAHCLTVRTGTTLTPGAIRVVAGTRRLSPVSLGSGETGPRAVQDVFVHPEFAVNVGDGFRFDVAVLRLVQPIPGASTVQLVQPSEDALWGAGAGNASARIAGWGDTDPTGRRPGTVRFPEALRAATIPLQSDARCSSTVGGGYGTAFERSTNLCGGVLSNASSLGIDACQGDSGGPLVADASDQTPRLVGIVSWGDGCAQRRFGAYSRIAALRDWIASIPGATDGGPAVGGPGGTLAVENLRRSAADHTGLRLAWDPASGGSAPERYGIWQRMVAADNAVDVLQSITTSTSARVAAPPTRRADAYLWVVRPLDAQGSAGPARVLRAGPTPDLAPPTTPARIALARRTSSAIVVRWTAARDSESGIARYVVQRRVPGRDPRWRSVAFGGNAPARLSIGGLRAGERVQVRVRAADRAGNAGGWRASPTFTTLS